MKFNYVDKKINQKLLGLHTCYLAIVLSVETATATLQPLSLIKAVGQDAKKQAVIPNVPILKHCLEDVTEGATVVCACMERDITQTKLGRFALPSLRHHSLSDSIVIGVIA